ncbi:FHIP family protein GH13096 isoform X2 [Drosophila grimshawi]|uniref:FHIP family protein GH13096 isoform X2 n=1 Tax=Drosophila grimshawi TaxID=7222 RepID=UPI000C86E58C|nr:FHIP family protein GH13096 isoform X2 [Drosophila grimshawi]
MSWLRTSPLRQSLTRNSGGNGSGGSGNSGNASATVRQRPIDAATDCDPRACYDSFCKHWQQAHEIIQHAGPPTHDDVLGVVSHLDYMVTLLLVELHHCNKVSLPTADAAPPTAPCLEYLLSENLLDKLYEWASTTGRYANAVRLEQLKLYELLVSHSRHQLLCHEPFLRPLLKILASSQGEIFPPDLEKRLVILLNQLCVVLMQNVHLLDLFFFSAQTQVQEQIQNGSLAAPKSGTTTNFIIFSLLIPYVHREGSLGHQARDALLLCMALSQKNSNIGHYIAQYSSICPLLVTGLGGLYSRLPNSIEVSAIDWHRITPDDVAEIPELTLFMNALEFCNAVVQVAHEMIKQQLLDFMYQGFIVPVLGPAILQTNIDSQISAMSYLDLILRSITEPGLMRAFVKFLLDTEKFDGERILDALVERLHSPDANLCMVTMALFDTLLGLHCEDLMLELLLKYMLPGKHVPISHRHKINKIDPYLNTTEFFLELTPDVMKRARDLARPKSVHELVDPGAALSSTMLPSLPSPVMSKTIGANWNYYGHYTGDSLYANIQAYLFEAHSRIAQCQRDCGKWANNYRYQKWPRQGQVRATSHALELARQFFSEFGTATPVAVAAVASSELGEKQLDSLQSIGESSGYESFKWRPDDADANDATTTTATSDPDVEHNNSSNHNNSSINSSGRRDLWRVSHSARNEILLTDLDFSEDLFAQGTVNLGPFLNAIWGKLQTFTSNSLYVNLHLTGLITRLAWYPLPLIHSLLLRSDIAITSDTPSFHQVLRMLKQQIDAELPVAENSLEIIDVARSSLIDREFRLINARKVSDNSPLHQQHHQQQQLQHTTNSTHQQQQAQQRSTYATLSAATPMHATPTSAYDPFRRSDNKRRSISASISNIFGRKSTSSTAAANPNPASSGLSQIYAFFTGAASTLVGGINGEVNSRGVAQENPRGNTCETSLSTTPRLDAQATSASSTNSSIGGSTQTLSATHSSSTLHGVESGPQTASFNSEPVSMDSVASMGIIANTSGTERSRDLALCAVLLDEWLKELAAIALEQSVVLVTEQLL